MFCCVWRREPLLWQILGPLLKIRKRKKERKMWMLFFLNIPWLLFVFLFFFLLLSKPVTNITVSASNILNNRIFTKKTMNQQKADQVEYWHKIQQFTFILRDEVSLCRVVCCVCLFLRYVLVHFGPPSSLSIWHYQGRFQGCLCRSDDQVQVFTKVTFYHWSKDYQLVRMSTSLQEKRMQSEDTCVWSEICLFVSLRWRAAS